MQYHHRAKAPEAILKMLERYQLEHTKDYKSAVKEIIQEIALLGLWRAKFFEKAAFYGGTALRILYQLDRFSEGLDFTLLKPDPHFDLKGYVHAVQDELASFGFTAEVRKKEKVRQTVVDSAFIKLNTLQNLIFIGIPEGIFKDVHPTEVLKIRFEIDTDPPKANIETETRFLLLPSPFSVKTYRLEDLFAGKVHATLCREWKGRTKGRDWYDLIWYIARGVRLNLKHLESRMKQSGNLPFESELTEGTLVELFEKKISRLDIESAKRDIIQFISDESKIALWSRDFFRQVLEQVRCLP